MSNGNYAISGLELRDDEYTVVQSLFRNRYRAYDSNGTLVLQGKQKMLKMKERFPFLDGDGEPVFTVEAGGILDVAGDYTLVDAVTEEPVVVLDNNWSLLTDVWKVRDPQTEALLATIRSKSRVAEVLRSIHSLLGLLPHKYEITDQAGSHVGSIDGRFSLRDVYDVRIDDPSDVPKEPVVAAAMVVDAIEGN